MAVSSAASKTLPKPLAKANLLCMLPHIFTLPYSYQVESIILSLGPVSCIPSVGSCGLDSAVRDGGGMPQIACATTARAVPPFARCPGGCAGLFPGR